MNFLSSSLAPDVLSGSMVPLITIQGVRIDSRHGFDSNEWIPDNPVKSTRFVLLLRKLPRATEYRVHAWPHRSCQRKIAQNRVIYEFAFVA